MNGSLFLSEKYLLVGGTLDISQDSEIIPDTSKACQNLEKWSIRKLEGVKCIFYKHVKLPYIYLIILNMDLFQWYIY